MDGESERAKVLITRCMLVWCKNKGTEEKDAETLHPVWHKRHLASSMPQVKVRKVTLREEKKKREREKNPHDYAQLQCQWYM